jgi:hypothetical protein
VCLERRAHRADRDAARRARQAEFGMRGRKNRKCVARESGACARSQNAGTASPSCARRTPRGVTRVWHSHGAARVAPAASCRPPEQRYRCSAACLSSPVPTDEVGPRQPPAARVTARRRQHASWWRLPCGAAAPHPARVARGRLIESSPQGASVAASWQNAPKSAGSEPSRCDGASVPGNQAASRATTVTAALRSGGKGAAEKHQAETRASS